MRLALAAAVLFSLAHPSAHADVALDRTRLIYPASEKEVGFRVRNEGAQPSLVQVWVDSGDKGQTPDESEAPFLVTPPVVRVDAQNGQRFRLRHTGAALPKDRESAFWLNVLEVPSSSPNEDGGNRLHIVFRSRIKLFFRPDGLDGRVDQAPAMLIWRAVPAGGGAGWELECENPSAYHISFSEVAWSVGGESKSLPPTDMLAPRGRVRIPLPSTGPSRPQGTVHFSVINDYGGRSEFSAPLKP
ncbi:fimbrial biogenesis chaperone [Luteimonas panaciterrae]|uniref:fimbrial biogenesis chaperone n=1 Tax=Luteimonas panaciterrae TaxID=363885 RepID=UPI001CFAAE9A|nr:molecular chaperone [Luteimonas panaciterrae]